MTLRHAEEDDVATAHARDADSVASDVAEQAEAGDAAGDRCAILTREQDNSEDKNSSISSLPFAANAVCCELPAASAGAGRA
mmetsp:Transcript_17263/g.39551  ORF Transcript_17263/g.39551 Transcript_17263/m.39551 type:complete len:82 (+) Transcript_17263:2157-2402(+)